MIALIGLLINLLILGVVVYAAYVIFDMLRLPPPVKNILNIILALIVILYILGMFGIGGYGVPMIRIGN